MATRIEDFYEKTTKKFSYVVKVDGAVQDITSDTVTVYFYLDGEKKQEKEADVSGGSGLAEFTLTKTDTALTPGYYEYEVWWVLASGEQYLIDANDVEIKDSLKQ